MNNKRLTVTSPLLPDLDEFQSMLKEIWDKKWLTNNGDFHKAFEKSLCQHLGVDHISLFTNGTIPLLAAFKALDLHGEVITTPYSFIATSHALSWCGLTPVFADVDPLTGNIDPSKIEALITPQTCAILPVHVYGQPCDTDAIQAIATRHGLHVIYDAAHTFDVKLRGKSLLLQGDLSTISFHATKVFNTLEGGAIVCHSEEMKRKIDKLKNFGFAGETEIVGIGINGKLDEIRSAFGILNLKEVGKAIAHREHATRLYRELLKDTPGLRFLPENPLVTPNYSHFPIFITAEDFGLERNSLYDLLKARNILARRYFYPLITDFEPYCNCKGAHDLPNARTISNQVLCLPLSPYITDAEIEEICTLIRTTATK